MALDSQHGERIYSAEDAPLSFAQPREEGCINDAYHSYVSRQTFPDDASLASTFSTNYTMSNLVGTGRILGNFYSTTGRLFEKVLGVIAGKMGYGPEAAYRRLRVQCCQRQGCLNANRKREAIYQSYTRLLRYASSDILQTRLLAIRRLADFFHLLLRDGDSKLVEGSYFVTGIRLLLREIEVTPLSRFPESYRCTLSNAVTMFSVMVSGHGQDLGRVHKTLMRLYWWDGIDQRESAWTILCQELFRYSNSENLSVRLNAIEKLSQFFADRRMIGWFLSSDSLNSQNHFSNLKNNIEQLVRLDISSRHREVVKTARSRFSSLLISIHVAGVTLIAPRNERLFLSNRYLRRVSREISSLSLRQERLWKQAFRTLLSYTRKPETVDLCIWYFESWTSQLLNGYFDFELALELSEALQLLMMDEELLADVDKTDLASLSYVIHKQLSSRTQRVNASGVTLPDVDIGKESNALARACKSVLLQYVEPRSDLYHKIASMDDF